MTIKEIILLSVFVACLTILTIVFFVLDRGSNDN